jgi:myo-inositol-1(or 4)-monophosphatase
VLPCEIASPSGQKYPTCYAKDVDEPLLSPPGSGAVAETGAANLAPAALLAFTLDAARAAGAHLREKLGTPLRIEFKGAHSNLVTDADTASEALIAGKIRAKYPDHRILAEEGTTGAQDSPYRWVIDPVDGTTNFAHGVPAFAVSIAVECSGELQAGVVYNPATEELFAAARGQGATLNDQPLRVSPIWRPESALTGCGAWGFTHNGRRVDALRIFSGATQGCRTTGAAALDLCYVACGRFDIFCGPSLSAWDVAAASLIIIEAGGMVTDFDGQPHRLDRRDILASNGALHPFAQRVVQGDYVPRSTLSDHLKVLRTRLAMGVAQHAPVGASRAASWVSRHNR